VSDAVRDSVVIKADVDTIMDVIAGFEAYPDWQPEMRQVEILATDDDGWATQVRFHLDAKVVRSVYTLAYTYTDASVAWHLVEGDQVRQIDGSYTLVDRGDGTTEVTYDLEVDIAMALPGLVKRQGAKRIVDGALKGLKKRVESLG
jgi:ribosome-associated toxin RatA of RatAB toxin-antitoxin module